MLYKKFDEKVKVKIIKGKIENMCSRFLKAIRATVSLSSFIFIVAKAIAKVTFWVFDSVDDMISSYKRRSNSLGIHLLGATPTLLTGHLITCNVIMALVRDHYFLNKISSSYGTTSDRSKAILISLLTLDIASLKKSVD